MTLELFNETNSRYECSKDMSKAAQAFVRVAIVCLLLAVFSSAAQGGYFEVQVQNETASFEIQHEWTVTGPRGDYGLVQGRWVAPTRAWNVETLVFLGPVVFNVPLPAHYVVTIGLVGLTIFGFLGAAALKRS